MSKMLLLGLQFLLLLLFVQPAKKSISSSSYNKQGKASYYGDEFDGRKTANGEIFSNADFTAAHRTLPFNTYLRATNLKNNLSVTVRVNDRGPFVKSRIIDLSESAARRIGSYMHGLATVKVEEVNVIQRSKELDSIFTCNDVLDCLGNAETLKGYSISLWKTTDLVHMLYIANELYLNEDIEHVYIVGKGIGNKRLFHLVVSDINSKKEVAERIDYFERKGFMKVSLLKL